MPELESNFLADIIAERRRQIEVEGWTAEHDDEHNKGEMAEAGACYAAGPDSIFRAADRVGNDYRPFTVYMPIWPWMHFYWKPTDRRRDLVKAAALIIAEGERLDRAAAREHLERADTREYVEQVKREAAESIPVDRSARQLSGGGPVTDDHRDIMPESGQQKGYVVLADAERAKGFTRPFRDAYRHLKCGKITTMSRDIAETYARDPHFYSGTFCSTCRRHFPVGEDGEFTWYEMDGREGPKVGT